MGRRVAVIPAWMQEAFDSEEYQRNFQRRAAAGILAPALESRWWEYLMGKPPEEIDINVHHDLSGKSMTEILALVDTIKQELAALDDEPEPRRLHG